MLGNIQRFLISGEVEFVAEHVSRWIWLPEIDIITGSCEMSRVVVVVRRPEPLPAWLLPLRVFSREVWFALMVSVLVYALTWRLVAGTPLTKSVAVALQVLSSCGGVQQGRVRATAQRLQLAGALLASAVVLASAYQGRLFTLSMKQLFYPEINLFQDLAKQNIPVYALENSILKYLKYPDPGVYTKEEVTARQTVGNNAKLLDQTSIVKRLKEKQNIAWIVTIVTWNATARKSDLGNFYRVMDTPITYLMRCYNARGNWPWTRAVSLSFLHFQESGLRMFWENDFSRKLKYFRIGKYTTPPTLENGPRVLQTEDFFPHLLLLGTGFVIATIVFVFENLLWYTREVNKK